MPSATDDALPENIKRFAEQYTAAWCSQDPARVAALYSEHGSLGHYDQAEWDRQLGQH